jgi:aldehyde dehydrogenase (NAD+)
MGYINSGKEAGATVHFGGERYGDEGYFIKPTIFTNVHSDMKIIKEEIFGPVAAIIKFKDEAEVVEMANNTTYGLAAHIFTQNVNRSIRVAHAVEAGSVWVCRFFCLVLLYYMTELDYAVIGQLRADC